MAELIAIGYDDTETADRAAEEVYRLAQDLVIEPEAVAVIIRDENGKHKVHTNHHPVAEGLTWGMLWGALSGLLFFVPVFGLAVGGIFGTLFGMFEKVGVDKGFQQQVRDMVRPGTSALFLAVDKVTPDKATEALSKFIGPCVEDLAVQGRRGAVGGGTGGQPAPRSATRLKPGIPVHFRGAPG